MPNPLRRAARHSIAVMIAATIQPTSAERGPSSAGAARPNIGVKSANWPVEVCFLIGDLAVGGTETQLLRLIEGLDRRLVRPHLCILDGTGAESMTLEPTCCPVMRLGVKSLRSLRAAAAARDFVRYLRRERIDVLQTFFADSTVFGGLIGRLARVPRIVRTRRDLVFWTTRSHRLLWRRVDTVLRRFACSAVITNSDACAEAVVSEEDIPRDRITVIPNGLSLDRFAAISSWRRRSSRSDKPTIGVVAMLRSEKGIDLFVRSLSQLQSRRRTVNAIVAGDGGLRNDLARLINSLGLADVVTLAGKVDNIPAFLEGIDIAVLPSYTEGFPNAIIEYMAAGRPIVATGVGGTRELITHGFDGWLVPPNDPAALSDGIQRLLDDPALAESLAAAARVTAREFAMETMIERHQDFYHRLVFGESTLQQC